MVTALLERWVGKRYFVAGLAVVHQQAARLLHRLVQMEDDLLSRPLKGALYGPQAKMEREGHTVFMKIRQPFCLVPSHPTF